MLVRIKILRYKKPPFAKMEAGSPTAPKAKGGFVDERHTKFNTFQVEMPVPYRIRTEISEERDIWKNQGRHRADTKKAMLAKGGRNTGSAGMSGSHTHVGKHTTEYKCSAVYGVLKREKQSDDI